MKLQTIATFFLGSMLFASLLPTSAPAADLPQLTADAAKWESGQSREPLQQIEQLVRESAGQRGPRAELEAAIEAEPEAKPAKKAPAKKAAAKKEAAPAKEEKPAAKKAATKKEVAKDEGEKPAKKAPAKKAAAKK